MALQYLKVEPGCTNDIVNMCSMVFLCLLGCSPGGVEIFEIYEFMARFLFQGDLGRGLDKGANFHGSATLHLSLESIW